MSADSAQMMADMLAEPAADSTIKFNDELTIYGAATLQPRLQAVLSTAQDITLDFSEVRDIDSAGVQLLLLLERECQALNRSLRISADSATTRDVFTLLNLPRFLQPTAAT